MNTLWLSTKKTVYTETQVEERKWTGQLLDLFRLNAYTPLGGFLDWSATENQNKRLFLAKKFTLNDTFDAATAKITIALVRKTPLLSFALQALTEQYDLWQGTSTNGDIARIKARLELLHANFSGLVSFVQGWNGKELQELTAFLPTHKNVGPVKTMHSLELNDRRQGLIQASNTFAMELAPFFWNKELQTGTQEKFAEILTQHFDAYSKLLPSETTDRRPLPFLNGMAPMQRLYWALRQAKAHAASIQTLTAIPKINEDNSIYPLKNRYDKTVAYLKNCKSPGGKKMEKLAWDLACLFGVEFSFNPTATTTLHYKQNGFGSKYDLSWRWYHYTAFNKGLDPHYEPPTAGTYTPLCDKYTPPYLTLAHFDCIDRGITGSFQPALDEVRLDEYLTKEEKREGREVPRDQLITATLITLLYGMMDAHAKNVFVLPEGALMFFDNTRIFPNGDLILAEDYMIPAYRSGLLEFPASYELLDSSERDAVISKMAEWEERIPFVEKFLNEFAFEKKVPDKGSDTLPVIASIAFEKKVPDKWFDTKRVIAHTKERLRRVKEAAASPCTLRDLCFAANPYFKWIATLHLAAFNPLNGLTDLLIVQQTSLPSVGSCPVQKVLNECQKKGLDPLALKTACEDKNLPYKTLLNTLFLEGGYKNPDQAEAKKHQALQLLIKEAVPDFKDSDIVSLAMNPNGMSKSLLLQFKNAGLSILEPKTPLTTSRILNQEEKLAALEGANATFAEEASEYLESADVNYVITPPANPYLELKFTLFFKEEDGNIRSVKIDITSKPGHLSLDDYTVPTLTLEKFKTFCDKLPHTLLYREKHEIPIATQSFTVEIEEGKYATIVIVDD